MKKIVKLFLFVVAFGSSCNALLADCVDDCADKCCKKVSQPICNAGDCDFCCANQCKNENSDQAATTCINKLKS